MTSLLLGIALVISFTPALAVNEINTRIEVATQEMIDELRVISKFRNLTKARKLVRSLKKSGQNARILSQSEEITLKSVSIGLYPNKKAASTVVQHLKDNGIDAFSYKMETGEFRVHAGALQLEDHYWNRFEQLLSLGYKRINTVLKTVTITHFLVVRDLIENLPPIIEMKTVIDNLIEKKKEHIFVTSFLYGRFKGEFNGWKELDQQSSSNYFSSAIAARTSYKKQWDMTYGIRFDALEQSSTNNLQKFEFQWLPTYFRYQKPHNQWKFGLIDARWDDRKQESLSDQISGKILVRYKLDEDVIDKRRPIIGARWQFNQSQYGLDVIINPVFRPAKMPDYNSIWHPVSRESRNIMGIRPTDTWQELVEKGSFADEIYQIGGIGVRMSQKVGQRTRATTIQFIRQSEPYYQLNPEVQKLISAGSTVNEALASASASTFTPRHPHSAIFSWEEYGKISHFEVSVSSNTPYTTTSYLMKTAVSMRWMMGFIYPHRNKTIHISSYFTGRRINTNEDILDRKTKLGLKGAIYKYAKNRRWKIGTAYNIDLDHTGVFLNPKINYEQNKYLKLSLYYQIFKGSNNTDNGYHANHSILGLSWQATF